MSATQTPEFATQVRFVRYDDVPLSELFPSPHQPRKTMDPLVIQALVESIQAVGVMQRPRVRATRDGYELIFGHQRVEACRHLGIERMSVEVVECDDLTARRMTLHENIKSTRLHPIEHAEGICKFLDATLCNDPSYGLIEGETAEARVYRVLVLLTKAPAEGEEDAPARRWVLGQSEHITQVIREMANKEPKSFLSADVALLQLPDEILSFTVEHGLKKGHARALGDLLSKDSDMYQEVMTRGVPLRREDAEEPEWVPLDQAGVGAIRDLTRKPRKVEPDTSEMAAYQNYIPVGVPGRAEPVLETSETMPWEDEAMVPMHELPLQSLSEAHAAITTLSADEWAALMRDASESARQDARRHWINIRRWAEEVMHQLG